MEIYKYNNTEVSSYDIFDINVMIAQKLNEYNLSSEVYGIAIAVSSEKGTYEFAPKVLSYYFYNHCGVYSNSNDYKFENFNSILADKIIVNSLTTKNVNIEDFTFKFGNGTFLFSSFFTALNRARVFLFISLNDAGNKEMVKYSCNSLISFVTHTSEKHIRHFIEHESIEKLKMIFGFDKKMVYNVLKSFYLSQHTKCDIIDYSEVRMESSHINALVKIAEYLGHGTYMGTMKEEVKNDIKKCIFGNVIDNNFSFISGIKLADSTIFYTGKGQDKEKLIVLS
jgi:hypothetical protein